MKINELINNLQSYKNTYGNLEIVYSSDDEGNKIESVKFAPTPMKKDWKSIYAELTKKEWDNDTELSITTINNRGQNKEIIK